MKPRTIVKKTAFVLLGFDSAQRVFRTTRDLIFSDFVVTAGRDIFQGWRNLVCFRPRKARVETFAAAVARLSVSEADIAARRADFAMQAMIFRILALASLISGIYWVQVETDALLSVMIGINATATTLMFLAFAFVRQFRVWQIDRRKLASVSAFITDSGLRRVIIGY